MPKYCILLFSLILSLNSCNNSQSSANVINDTTQLKQNNTSNFLATMDSVEHFFDNQNYLLINNNDSSYLYFTRIGKNSFFTHSYRIVNGDSTHLKIDTIKANNENKLQWSWMNTELILQECLQNKTTWLKQNDSISFEKKDLNHFKLLMNSKEYLLNKTLPISLFLVRFKHDYLNKTHYAFDTTNYTKTH